LTFIASEDDWVRYVRIVKTIVPPYLDVVVRNLSVSHCDAPFGLSPQMSNASRIEAPLPELPEEVVVVPNAQSGSSFWKKSLFHYFNVFVYLYILTYV
jgi:hypothetical protein